MQLLSLGFQYVITALVMLCREEEGTAISAADLARPLNSPGSYLSQRLAMLIPAGILGSRRGAKGGVFLVKNPNEISLFDVLITIEGDQIFNRCFFGYDGCGDKEPCPCHDEYSTCKNHFKSWLQNTTLADLRDRATDKWIQERITFNPRN